MLHGVTVLPQKRPGTACSHATTFYLPHSPVTGSPPALGGEEEELGGMDCPSTRLSGH